MTSATSTRLRRSATSSGTSRFRLDDDASGARGSRRSRAVAVYLAGTKRQTTLARTTAPAAHPATVRQRRERTSPCGRSRAATGSTASKTKENAAVHRPMPNLPSLPRLVRSDERYGRKGSVVYGAPGRSDTCAPGLASHLSMMVA